MIDSLFGSLNKGEKDAIKVHFTELGNHARNRRLIKERLAKYSSFSCPS